MTDFERRLRGGLRDLAAHAPQGPDDRHTAAPLDQAPRRRRNGFIAIAGTAAVVAIAIGAPVLLEQMADQTPPAPTVAESGGSTSIPTAATHASGRPDQPTLDEVAETLSRHAVEPGYGKVVVDYDASTVRLYWKGALPADLAQVDRSTIKGVRVEVIAVEFSEAELVAAGRQATSLLEASKIDVAATMPNEPMSGIVIEIVGSWSGSVDDVERQVGVPITVRVVDEGPVPADE